MKMKRTVIIAGTMLLLASMFVSIGMAAALETYYPQLQVTAKGVIWYIPVELNGDGKPDFNANLLQKSTVVATVYTATSIVTVKPILILTTKNLIILFFCPKSLPDAPAIATLVTADLVGGDSIYASGPGFTYRIK